MITTLVYAFVINYDHRTNPVDIVWRTLTFDPVHNTSSPVVAWLFGLTWLVAAVIMLIELARAGSLPNLRPRWLGGMLFAALSMGLAAAFALIYAGQPGIDMVTVVGTIADQIGVADRQAALFDLYAASLGMTLLLMSLTLVSQPADRTRWANRRWSAMAAIPITVIMLVWNNIANFNPIRADTLYRQGQGFDQQDERESAIAVYEHALTFAPNEDVYYRGLAAAYLRAADTAPTDDGFDAARASFARARALNPLDADYAAGLAQTYQHWAARTTDAALKAQRLALADQFYTEALRLRPNDTALRAAR
jgi:tetratricopeptide (TPR) repeat protein